MDNHISVEDSQIILKKMCQVVGVDYEQFDFSQSKWFQQHSWTLEEQEKFVRWLGKLLRKKGYVGQGTKRGMDWGEYEAKKIVFNYGWSIKDAAE